MEGEQAEEMVHRYLVNHVNIIGLWNVRNSGKRVSRKRETRMRAVSPSSSTTSTAVKLFRSTTRASSTSLARCMLVFEPSSMSESPHRRSKQSSVSESDQQELCAKVTRIQRPSRSSASSEAACSRSHCVNSVIRSKCLCTRA